MTIEIDQVVPGARFRCSDGTISEVTSVGAHILFVELEERSVGYSWGPAFFCDQHSPLEAAPPAPEAPPAAQHPADLPPNPKQACGAQKPDLSLIPPVSYHHAALAFENGAGKYGPYNWREKGVEARTYIAAAQRHISDWLDRTERASDSDVHNLGHAIACLAILLDAQEQGNLIDNRPIAGKSAEVLERLKEWKRSR